jgi:hypothetical protein
LAFKNSFFFAFVFVSAFYWLGTVSMTVLSSAIMIDGVRMQSEFEQLQRRGLPRPKGTNYQKILKNIINSVAKCFVRNFSLFWTILLILLSFDTNYGCLHLLLLAFFLRFTNTDAGRVHFAKSLFTLGALLKSGLRIVKESGAARGVDHKRVATI